MICHRLSQTLLHIILLIMNYILPFNSSTQFSIITRTCLRRRESRRYRTACEDCGCGRRASRKGSAGEVISWEFMDGSLNSLLPNRARTMRTIGRKKRRQRQSILTKTARALRRLPHGRLCRPGVLWDAEECRTLADFSAGKAAMTLGSTASLKQIRRM